MTTKLSDLSPIEQEEIVNRRIEETRMLKKYAHETMDPIALAACELDSDARLLGVHMEFSEDLDGDEL